MARAVGRKGLRQEPRNGERGPQNDLLSPHPGIGNLTRGSMAHAMGYLLSLLCSYFRDQGNVQKLSCARLARSIWF